MFNNAYLKELNVSVFDIETTGLFHSRDCIINTGFCNPQGDVVQDFTENPADEKRVVEAALARIAQADAEPREPGAERGAAPAARGVDAKIEAERAAAYLRAVLIAHSFASAPELEKNTFFIPVRAQSICARSAHGSV